jgi:predicted transposase YdaD
MTIAEQLLSEGMEKGIEKGMELERIEIAKEMLLDREPLTKIMKYSKLSEEQINELKKQMNH